MRILVAAESPAIAKSWCAMFAAQHYEIDVTTDGHLAFQEFFGAGANDVWSKPIGLPEIITDSVQKILNL